MIEGDIVQHRDLKALWLLDIPFEKQAQFVATLADKYRRQFKTEHAFVVQIKDTFTYKREDDAHVLNLGHVHPEDFFEAAAVGVLSSAGVFASPIKQASKTSGSDMPGSDDDKPESGPGRQ